MLKCEICGITEDIKHIFYNKKIGMYLCNKHNVQYRFNGRFLDNNPHSTKDPNTYRIMGDYVEVDCYDNHGNISGTFICDIEDLHFVQEHIWRVTLKGTKPYIVTGNNKNYPITYFHRLVMNYTGELEIDHIDGNALNNRKSNLRLADRILQCRNLAPKCINKFGVRGISYDKKYNLYTVDFTIDKRRIYIKPFKTVEEAVYARYLLEQKYNPDRYFSNDEVIFSYINKLNYMQKYNVEYYIHMRTFYLDKVPVPGLIYIEDE
jgi:hypothetical protein